MKFIIIGLGNFGISLAVKLTEMGHEVLGVDKQMEKVDEIKDKIAMAFCLDCKYQEAVNSLPLKNTDVVIVTIGEDEGANLLTTALLKKAGVPRLISRAVSPIHSTILEAMEISEIVRPEEEAAEHWAKKLSVEGIIDSFELTDKYSIIEVRAPKSFSGKTIEQIGFSKNYNVIVLTIMKNVKEKNILGIFRRVTKPQIQGVAKADSIIMEGDTLVLYGHNDDIQNMLKQNK